MAVIFAEAGNTDGAVQLYQRTLEIDPTHAPAHFAIADFLYTQGDTKTAIIHYQRAIESDPTFKTTSSHRWNNTLQGQWVPMKHAEY